MAGQCFYGFTELESSDPAGEAEFGAFLPDDAITAVGQWVKARNTAERVSYCISVSLSNLDICCSLTTVTVLIISYHNDIQFVPQAEKAELVAQAKNIMQSPDGSGSSGAEASSTRKRRQPATTPSRLSIVSQESA